MVLTCPSKGAPAVTNVNTLPDGPGSLVRVLPSCMKRSVTVVALLLSKTLAHVLFARRHDNHLHWHLMSVLGHPTLQVIPPQLPWLRAFSSLARIEPCLASHQFAMEFDGPAMIFLVSKHNCAFDLSDVLASCCPRRYQCRLQWPWSNILTIPVVGHCQF